MHDWPSLDVEVGELEFDLSQGLVATAAHHQTARSFRGCLDETQEPASSGHFLLMRRMRRRPGLHRAHVHTLRTKTGEVPDPVHCEDGIENGRVDKETSNDGIGHTAHRSTRQCQEV